MLDLCSCKQRKEHLPNYNCSCDSKLQYVKKKLKKLENNTTITRSNEVWNVKDNLCQNFVDDQLSLLYVFLLRLIYLFCLL